MGGFRLSIISLHYIVAVRVIGTDTLNYRICSGRALQDFHSDRSRAASANPNLRGSIKQLPRPLFRSCGFYAPSRIRAIRGRITHEYEIPPAPDSTGGGGARGFRADATLCKRPMVLVRRRKYENGFLQTVLCIWAGFMETLMAGGSCAVSVI